MEKLVILGSGCAGYTAAIYAARANLNPLIISGKEEGGQLILTSKIENYPGFSKGIDGIKLMQEMKSQALKYGTRMKDENATGFKKIKNGFEIQTKKGKILTSAVIIATGANARWLGIPSEKRFKGRGVHTCATCDGYFYKNKEVAVVGGGDSACEDALLLAKSAKKVTIIHRRNKLRASKIMQNRIKENKKIKIKWNSLIQEIKGDNFVESIILKDIKTNKKTEMKIKGIFIAIGHIPNTEIFKGKIKLDENGFVVTDKKMHTNIEGIFAAGDVQDPIFKQAITSAGTGCVAAMEAERYYEEQKKDK